MNIVERAKNIMLTPKTEWQAVAADPTPTPALITGYVLPLAGIAAIAGFISAAIIGTSMAMLGTYRMPMMWALGMMIYQLVMSVVSVFVIAFIIDVLAPTFGGQKNFNQAIKVAAYSYTAGWLGHVVAIIPFIGWILGFVIGLYGIYLLYLGLPRVMKNPEDKSIGYTVVVVIVAIVVGFVIAAVAGVMTAGAGLGAAALRSAGSPRVTYDKDSRMGQLQENAKKMEEAGKRVDAASKSGEQKAQMEAAMGALGTALSGGKGVEPVQLDVLKPLLPEKAAGLPRTSQSSDRSGVAGLMVAKAHADYGDQSGKNLSLEVVDTGGAAGLMGLASWAGLSSEKETDSQIERMRKDGNRMVHEQISKKGGTNEYSVILADRFVVTGRGQGVDFDAVKGAVNSLDLGKIESIK